MTTVKEVVTDALEDILEQSADEPLSASDGEAGIRYLNDMMFMWDAKGINLGYTEVSNMGDSVTVASGAIFGIKAHLAVYLATKFNAEITPGLVSRAKQGWRAILNLVSNVATRQYPSILPMGSGNSYSGGVYDSRFYAETDDAILTETGGLIALELSTTEV